MNRRFVVCLALLFPIIAACRPIRPQSELASSLTPVTGTEITTTATITGSVPMTARGTPFAGGGVAVEPGGSSSSSARQRPTAVTAPTSITGQEEITSCPTISDEPFHVDVLAHWDEGDQRHYVMRKSRTELIAGQEYVAFESSTPLTITVVEARGDDGYDLEWQYGVPEAVKSEGEKPSPLEIPFSLPPEVVLNYSTDSAGTFLMANNQEEVQQEVLLIFDQIFDELVASGEFPPQTIDSSRERVAGLIEDPANFDLLFTQEIALFHTLYAMSFDSVEPVIVPDLRPNLLGGAPIPSEMSVTPTHYDAEQGCLYVTFENVADPIATRNSILQALQDQAKQLGVPGPDEDDLPPEMTLNDSIGIEMDVESGWPLSIVLERSITLGSQGRVEVTEILPIIE